MLNIVAEGKSRWGIASAYCSNTFAWSDDGVDTEPYLACLGGQPGTFPSIDEDLDEASSKLSVKKAAVLGILGALAVLTTPEARSEMPNTLTATERAGGWLLLFDGESTRGWRGFKRSDVLPQWQATEGSLALIHGGGGDLVTDREYAD